MNDNVKHDDWRKIIIKHYSQPINKKEKINSTFKTININSSLCVDNFNIGIFLDKDKKINKIEFNGVGCSISTSSIDIMIEEIKNKNIETALNIINNYFLLFEKNSIFDKKQLGNLIVFSNIYKQPNRIKCATIGINGIKRLIENCLNG